jgi:hypothetical protein
MIFEIEDSNSHQPMPMDTGVEWHFVVNNNLDFHKLILC